MRQSSVKKSERYAHVGPDLCLPDSVDLPTDDWDGARKHVAGHDAIGYAAVTQAEGTNGSTRTR